MNPVFNREFITEALAQSILDPRSRALYDLCFLHRGHLRDEIVTNKLRLIARSHAEGDVPPEFSPEHVAHRLSRSAVDHWFCALSTAEDLDTSLLLELHKRVMHLFTDLAEPEARRLAAHYLHFHFPELFYLYDSRTEAAARSLAEGDCGFLALTDFDPTYGQFLACCRRLTERLTPLVGRRLTPRELDRVLRAWQGHDSGESLARSANSQLATRNLQPSS